MLGHFIFMLCISLVFSDIQYVTKKNCKDVDQSLCHVHNVIVDPCPWGPTFCILKTNKNYGLTLDMTPYFSAQKLKFAINGDVANDGNFATVIRASEEACGTLACPLAAEERRIFDVNLMVDKKASGKFPIKFKLWNEDDESQSCCFTFTVKVK